MVLNRLRALLILLGFAVAAHADPDREVEAPTEAASWEDALRSAFLPYQPALVPAQSDSGLVPAVQPVPAADLCVHMPRQQKGLLWSSSAGGTSYESEAILDALSPTGFGLLVYGAILVIAMVLVHARSPALRPGDRVPVRPGSAPRPPSIPQP